MTKNKKLIASGAALVMAVVLALTGTFAWQSISQTAKNEKTAVINPGGRLHDDFNGVDKRVYVENFTEPGNGTAIFARIRLDEYMEYGEGANLKDTDPEYANRTVTLVNGADKSERDDVNKWLTRKPGDTAADNPFVQYWTWSFGGATMYMPTFDKDKDSLQADINGTWDFVDVNGDDDPYGDYVDWAVVTQKTADEYYDADTDDTENDHTDPAQENVNYKKVADQTHYSKSTLGAEMVTMADWIAAGSNPGNFWVWDEDGWAYWANPIQPGETTGMFLSRIDPEEPVDDSWYYGINVVAQFVTADDVGWKDSTGFYAVDATKPTANAEQLLAVIGVKSTSVIHRVSIDAITDDSVTAGGTQAFTGKAYKAADDSEDAAESAKITWSVLGSRSDTSATKFDGNTLTVGADEKAENLTVVATYLDRGVTKVTARYIIKVAPAAAP